MAETIHSEPSFSLDADDDLPRTIRRERDAKQAREREARERDARERLSMEPAPVHVFERQVPYGDRQVPYGFAAPSGSIATVDVPFSKLMALFPQGGVRGDPRAGHPRRHALARRPRPADVLPRRREAESPHLHAEVTVGEFDRP